MKHLATCVCLAFAVVTTACAPTPTSRAAGQVVDDAAISARVKTEIGQSLGLKEAATINVDTYRGVVSLAGFVNSTDKKAAAGAAARQANGVQDVRNNLEVKPPQ